MNPEQQKREEEIFQAALDISDLAERQAYLDGACGGDPELRRSVEELLQADERAAETFQTQPDGAFPLSGERLVIEQPGDRIGRYKLLEQIGEGGFGVVFMAEQEEPVRRRVALKILKAGMDTRQVVARFEAERQALAMMDHASIAKVFDGGATPAGRPFFVMELVRGVRITDHCDQHRLSVRERLGLFIKVCHAVQHAHQQGIIHRDLKPSNILVTLQDGVPMPKVIDFGIAKAIAGQRLTAPTVFTEFQQCIGTPAYMSLEQTEKSGLEIDARSDIYSLGVLLYELLTGQTPFDTGQLLRAGLDEMRRIIREVDPPRPSTRLRAMSAPDALELARHRGEKIPALIHLIRGDLDWIVMKCLEKDRMRRYGTATGLAREMELYMANQPIVARAPSHLYRLQKLVRRNMMVCMAGGAIVALLVTGLAVAARLFIKEGEAREQVIAAEEAISRFYSQAFLLQEQGKLTEAETLLREGLAAATILSREARPDVAHALHGLAEALLDRGKLAEAENLQREALAMQRKLFGNANSDVADSLATLALTLMAAEKFTDAESVAREYWSLHERGHPDDWRAFHARSLLGASLLQQKRYAEAESLLFSGYEGLTQREHEIPAKDRAVLVQAVQRIVDLYDGLGKPAQASEWKHKVEARGVSEAKLRQEASAAALGIKIEQTNSLGMVFRLIPAGEFQMGSAEDELAQLEQGNWFFSNWKVQRISGEMPLRRVKITRPFVMGIHEVTVGQFHTFIMASGYKTVAERSPKGGFGWSDTGWRQAIELNWANPGFSQSDDHPVGNVAWEDANEFCRWLSQVENRTYRLPTEAEWEYACRAGTQTRFHVGDSAEDLKAVANIADQALQAIYPQCAWAVSWNDRFAFSAPVGQFKPNAFGLYDMHGNVWEWCLDSYDPEYYRRAPTVNPVCRDGGSYHVFRGGGWDNHPGFCRSADRYSSHSPTLRTEWAGFRIVMEIDSPAGGAGKMK